MRNKNDKNEDVRQHLKAQQLLAFLLRARLVFFLAPPGS